MQEDHSQPLDFFAPLPGGFAYHYQPAQADCVTNPPYSGIKEAFRICQKQRCGLAEGTERARAR